MTPMTGASVSRTVYSGAPAELGVRRSPTPLARASTMTTPWPPAEMLAGTRIPPDAGQHYFRQAPAAPTTTGSTPSISVASAGTAAARRPTSVSSTAVSSTPSPSPSSQAGKVSDSSPAWPSSFHTAESCGSSLSAADGSVVDGPAADG